MKLFHQSKPTAAGNDLLKEPRFEVMPFSSIDEQLDHLPDGAAVAITASPQLGLDATIEWSEKAAERGFEVIPHISARYVRDNDHLDDVASRMKAAGVEDIFVPGGDREEPLGEFESAYQLLVALDELGYEFADVGVTGYPEGHEFIPDDVLWEHLEKKAPYSTYIVTQLCYDAETVVDWIRAVRAGGVDLPVEVGIPGVMKYQRLIGISKKVGVGDSVRFLRKTSGIFGFVKELVGSGGTYRPDDLVDGIAQYADDAALGISGFHIYTFNQVPDTEEWRQGRLQH